MRRKLRPRPEYKPGLRNQNDREPSPDRCRTCLVGLAFPDYSTKKPRAAHDTFLQIAAESGVMAGVMYLLIVAAILIELWRRGNKLRQKDLVPAGNFIYCMDEALLTSFIGLVTCSIFLSLGHYEIFYFLCLLAGALTFICEQEAVKPALNHDYEPC